MRLVKQVAVAIGIGCVGFVAAGTQAMAKGGAVAPPPPVPAPGLAEALVASTKIIADTWPEPHEGSNLNASKSNINRIVGMVEQSVLCATSVKSGKSNVEFRKAAPPKLTATYVKADAKSQPLILVAKGELGEAPVGTLTTDRALVFPAAKPVAMPVGTYTVNLLDATHHKQRGRTEAIIEIKGSDGTTVGGIFVKAGALISQLATPAGQQQFAEVYANTVVLNQVVSMLEEGTPTTGVAARATGTGMEPVDGAFTAMQIVAANGERIDLAAGKPIAIGGEQVALAELAEIRIAWTDTPTGRWPGATLNTKQGRVIRVPPRGGVITSISLTLTQANGVPFTWSWSAADAAARKRRPSELTVVRMGT